ncbi:MAG: hypothetical protein AcusKO_30480 [Acuticoccus sp.]
MLWALAGAALLAVNIGGAALFVADKRRARRNGARRVPERVLLGLALAGAAPVMVWLTYRVRHKTRKEPFRTLLRVILGLQIVVALALAALWAGIL